MKPYNQFNLTEWLSYLENRHQQEIQLGLTRVRQVAQQLDLLNLNSKVITVAGTNGKGSTVAALEAVYLTAGYCTAAYTSPHLIHFNERIRVNGQFISDADLCHAFTVIEGTLPAAMVLTYFEMTTLAALMHFKANQAEVVILEVGLGGRLDATNIIDADLAIITTIDFDHQAYLGHTKEAIGYEKAGILRLAKPFIYADNNPPASVLAQAELLKTPLFRLNHDYHYQLREQSLTFCYLNQQIELPRPVLHGNSIAAAIMATLCLQADLPIKENDWQHAITHLFLPGRLQVIGGLVATLFDVAHNPQAASHLAIFIKQLNYQGKVHAVFAALKDKDIAGIIAPLIDCIDYWYPALLAVKRAATVEQMNDAFAIYDQFPVCYADPQVAYKQARQQANSGDLIVVYGSFITVGMILPAADGYRKLDKLLVSNRIKQWRENEISN